MTFADLSSLATHLALLGVSGEKRWIIYLHQFDFADRYGLSLYVRHPLVQ